MIDLTQAIARQPEPEPPAIDTPDLTEELRQREDELLHLYNFPQALYDKNLDPPQYASAVKRLEKIVLDLRDQVATDGR